MKKGIIELHFLRYSCLGVKFQNPFIYLDEFDQNNSDKSMLEPMTSCLSLRLKAICSFEETLTYVQLVSSNSSKGMRISF